MKYKTHSPIETKKLAGSLAKKHSGGGIFLLYGTLGAGKTTFTQGFAEGLGIKDKIISPTFILMKRYSIPGNKDGFFYHLDLYRLDSVAQIENLGIGEIFDNPKNIILIEWADKLGKLSPKSAAEIHIKSVGDEIRELEVRS